VINTKPLAPDNQTLDGAEYGFINTGWVVFGGVLNRIENGGVFQLTFNGVDLFRDVNFDSTVVESEYGRGNQYILANRITAVSEPSAFTLVCLGAAGLILFSLHQRKSMLPASSLSRLRGCVCGER
jgi:hypothetical protein